MWEGICLEDPIGRWLIEILLLFFCGLLALCQAALTNANESKLRASAAEGDGLFRPEHPSHSRYLWGALARNNSVVWTKDGLAWLERTILRAAPVNENVAILLLSALQLWRGFEEPLRSETAALLGRIRDALPASAPDAVALAGRVRRLVG